MKHLQNKLKTLIQEIQITPELLIRHVHHGEIEGDAALQGQLNQLDGQLARKYVNYLLRNFIYDTYYNGLWQDSVWAEPSQSASQQPSHILENNTLRGRHVEFYRSLHLHNTGRGYFDPGWQLLKTTFDQLIVVQKQGLKLHIERTEHLSLAEQSATVGDIVSVRLPKNLINPGLYIAVGNAGTVDSGDQPITIYWNLSAETILKVMRDLTLALNQLNLPFTFTIPDHPNAYQRYDTATLCLRRQDYKTVYPTLQQLYAENRQPLRFQTPLFTKPLAPGLALAETPTTVDKTTKRSNAKMPVTFGQHRCQLVANGLLLAHDQGAVSQTVKLAAIEQQFEQAQITLEKPYLNAGSDDIYPPLIEQTTSG